MALRGFDNELVCADFDGAFCLSAPVRSVATSLSQARSSINAAAAVAALLVKAREARSCTTPADVRCQNLPARHWCTSVALLTRQMFGN